MILNVYINLIIANYLNRTSIRYRMFLNKSEIDPLVNESIQEGEKISNIIKTSNIKSQNCSPIRMSPLRSSFLSNHKGRIVNSKLNRIQHLISNYILDTKVRNDIIPRLLIKHHKNSVDKDIKMISKNHAVNLFKSYNSNKIFTNRFLMKIERPKRERWYNIRPRLLINHYYRRNFIVKANRDSSMNNRYVIINSLWKPSIEDTHTKRIIVMINALKNARVSLDTVKC